MAIVFNCPHCKEPYRLKDDAAGRSAKCRNPNCGKMIHVPKPVSAEEAEALALKALLEEAASAAPKAEAPPAKIKFTCSYCSTDHEVDASMEGKNTRCRECGQIIRVPKLEKVKAADWRDVHDGKPSLARRDVPVLEGATEAAKMVSADAMKEGGGFEVEEEEDPRERKIRRIKQLVYGSMLLVLLGATIWYVQRERKIGKDEKLMLQAVTEIEKPTDGARPEFQAAIHRYAGEFRLRATRDGGKLDDATTEFKQALGKLQSANANHSDRAALLFELSAAMTILGGDAEQVRDEKRLPWTDVQKLIQQRIQQSYSIDADQREWGARALTRAFAARKQPGLVYNILRYAYPGDEAECAGRIGLELLLMNQKEAAQEVLKKAPEGSSPALTALRLALNPETVNTPETPLIPAPSPKGPLALRTRLAYAEAWAYQGKIQEARDLANREGPIQEDRARALVLVAAAALDVSRDKPTALAILETAAPILLSEAKDAQRQPWLMVRAAGLCAAAGKADLAQKLAEGIPDTSIRAWANLEILRARLSAQGKQKAEEAWLDGVANPASAELATLMGCAEFARHQAAAGETSYLAIIERNWAKGVVKPFGLAGSALGNQDRTMRQ